MAHPTKNERHIKNRELYRALLSGNENRVIELCKQVQKGPLHELTIHHDTVLHMATYAKQAELVLSLLREVLETENHMLAAKNDVGNTILHDAATSNKLIPAAREMLRRVPALLHERNRSGETALAVQRGMERWKCSSFLTMKSTELLQVMEKKMERKGI
ncbi:hypothetical protein ACSBR1_016511 [Camellia fascicularis]